MTDDTTFERDLRAMLAARDPGRAPTSLATAIDTRLEADRPSRRLVTVGRWVGTAAVGALAAVLVLVVMTAHPTATGPGSAPLPTPSEPYTIQPGDGVVTGEYLPLAQGLVGLVALAILARACARTGIRSRRIAAALGVLALVYVALTIGPSSAIGFASGVSGVDPGVNLGSNGGIFVNADGDRPFTLYLTVTNTSRLPLEVLGLAEDSGTDDRLPRLVGLGVLSDTSIELSTTARLPFRSVALEPGESIDLAILGMAGSCAIHPSAVGGGYTGIDRVRIVYEQLTIRHWAAVRLLEGVKIAWPVLGCP